MATIKSFTDINQAKALSKILPIGSADMTYYACVKDWKGNPVPPKWNKPVALTKEELALPCSNFQEYKYIPCWSLAALLSVLPVIIGDVLSENALRLRIDKSETDFDVWYDNLDSGMVEEGLDIIESNPVDACYEMILKLNELKML